MPSTTTVRVTPRTADQLRVIAAELREHTGQSPNTAQTLAYLADLVDPEAEGRETFFPDLCQLVKRHWLVNVCPGSASLPREGGGAGILVEGNEDVQVCPTCSTIITLNADHVIPVHVR